MILCLSNADTLLFLCSLQSSYSHLLQKVIFFVLSPLHALPYMTQNVSYCLKLEFEWFKKFTNVKKLIRIILLLVNHNTIIKLISMKREIN